MTSEAGNTPETEDATRRSIGARRNPASEEAILDAAEAVLRENGIAGFSIEAVARRARAGKPTIYRWWPHRTALMLDVYKRFKNAKAFPDTGSLRGDLVSFLGENHTHQLVSTDTIESAAQALVDSVNTFSTQMSASRAGAVITLTYLGEGATPATSTAMENMPTMSQLRRSPCAKVVTTRAATKAPAPEAPRKAP